MAGRVGPGVGKPQGSSVSTIKLHTGNIKSNEDPVSRAQSALTVAGARKHLPQIPPNAAGGLLAPPSPMTMDRSMVPTGGDAVFQPFFLEYALTSE
jgi:hypothetical protein